MAAFASLALCNRIAVVEVLQRIPGNRGVAVFASGAGAQVISRHAGGRDAIMALKAAGGDASVIEHADFP